MLPFEVHLKYIFSDLGKYCPTYQYSKTNHEVKKNQVIFFSHNLQN